ncbi:MAG TPA: Calx-beta domain-containing protein [Pyrinomonadaceae bacterium]
MSAPPVSQADLAVTKVDTPDPVTTGSDLTYTINITNNGPDSAANASWSDTLPTGTTFVSLSSVSGWTCTTPAPGDAGTITCSNPSLASGSNDNFDLFVMVNQSIPGGSTIINTATATSSTPDGNSNNNSGSATTTVFSPSSVRGFKTVSGGNTPGSTFNYTIVLSNNSTSDQQDNPGPEFTDVLPAGVTLVSADASSGTPTSDVATNTVTWDGVIPAMDSVTINITATINNGTDGQTISNQGTVNFDADGNGTNETSGLTDDPFNQNSSADPTIFTVCAANTVVTTNADGGPGSLRQAILDACPGTTITFDMTQVTSPIVLSNGEFVIDKDLSILGPTSASLTISGANSSRIFNVHQGFNFTLSNLTITGGQASSGGGIYSLGNLTIRNSTFTGNYAIGGAGGAIDSEDGNLHIINSTISGNKADKDGGGLLNGGTSIATLTNVTITNNRADADDDITGAGGGVAQVSSSNFTLNNTIVAGNFKGTGATADDFFVSMADPNDPNSSTSPLDASSSNNLIGVDTGLTSDISNGTSGNKIGTAANPLDPRLGPLANNGGPTQTHFLLSDSPALNAGDSTLALDNGMPLTTDQRGTGFPRIINSAVDIGALEANYAISATDGTPQSAVINTAFSTQLQATVTVEGNPGIGISVTFTAPATGASGTFQGNGNTVTVQTNASGVATAPVFTANGTGGNYNVVATLPSGSPAATFSLTNAKANQMITFGPLSDKTFGDPPFNVSATSSSGLPVSFSVFSGPATISSNTVTITGAGTVTIRASQAGDNNYNPATPVDQSFNVAKANQTITFGALANKTFGDPDFNVSATASSGLAVSFAASGQCTVSGNTVHLTGAGSCTITASQAGDANYNAATPVPQTFGIAKADQTITFGALANKTFGDPDFTVSATSSSNLSVNFAATGNCTVTGSTVHLTGAGSCTITASQSGDSNYNAATSVQQTFTISKASQTITFGPLANKSYGDPDFNVSATSSSGLSVSFAASGQCTVSGNTVHITGAGSCTITASQSGDSNFNAATNVQQSFNIAKALPTTTVTSSVNPSEFGQSVTFTATVTGPANTGTPTGTVQFTDDGINMGSAVTLNSSGVATFTTSSLTFGLHTITAIYSGDANFGTSPGTLKQTVPSLPTLDIKDKLLPEGNAGTTSVNFTVTLSRASSTTVTVDYTTADGTATVANNDYQPTSGTLTFNPGDLTKTITVLVNGDTVTENDEDYFVKLSNPTNAFIMRTQATGTILNDDPPAVEFSAATYSVNESGLHATITVNRLGNISQPATVDYQTSDPSGLTPCSQVTGNASQRCDYAISAGTLRFAAGESSKTIFIPIVNDVYVEGPESFTITLSNPTGTILGLINSATVTINDDDNGTGVNPITDDAFFIRQLYIDFLDREPEPAGLQGWLNILNHCSMPTDCDRINVALGFVRSPEFQDRGYFAFSFYQAALGRNPLYNEFIPDMARLSGFLNSSELEANKVAFVNEFMNRQEFKNLYDSTIGDPTSYVDKLLQTAGLPNHPSRNTWIAGLSNNTLTRAQVLRQFIESTEVYTKFYNQAFVVMNYFGFLRRDPDAAYQTWIDIFNHTNDYRVIVNGFINSPEYPLRFGP